MEPVGTVCGPFPADSAALFPTTNVTSAVPTDLGPRPAGQPGPGRFMHPTNNRQRQPRHQPSAGHAGAFTRRIAQEVKLVRRIGGPILAASSVYLAISQMCPMDEARGSGCPQGRSSGSI